MNAMQILSRIALLIAFLFSAAGVQPAEARSVEWCSCVKLALNRLNLANGALGPNAAGAGNRLLNLGYELVSEPRAGDVVVMQNGLYANTPDGHIAFLTSVSRNGNTYTLWFDGANQSSGNPKPSEYGCNNVTNARADAGVNDSRIAYYRLRSTGSPTHGSRIIITSVHSGLVIDVKGRGTSSGTIVQQSRANGGGNQEFILVRVSDDWFTLRPAHTSNMCLDVKSRSTSNGARVQISRCHGESNQQFRFHALGSGQFAIIARHSNAALDVTNWSTSSGTALQMWQQHLNQNNQRWTIRFR